jgi:hypothetical protein
MSIDRLLSWFPNAWRSRYEAEVRELLDAHPFTWRARRDLVRACVDAWWREAASWGSAVARFAAAVGVRVVVVLALGWLIIRGVEGLVPSAVVLAWWPAAASDAWRGVMTFTQIGTFIIVVLYGIRPYTQTLDPDLRPTWVQTSGWVLFYALLIVADGRPARLPEAIFMGQFATMRFSPWLQMHGRDGRAKTTVLGLR